MLVLLGRSAAGTGLLSADGSASADAGIHDRMQVSDAVLAVLGPPALASAAQPTQPLAGFCQATQAGFSPINATLSFGPPADVAAGWDGTLWAIDDQGAPHLYDPLTDTWLLHGTRLDAVLTSIPWLYPLVYFKDSEVLIADGQQSAQPIASVWPQLPKSYQLRVNGAFTAHADRAFKLVLFRSGTYLTVPPPAPAPGLSAPPTASGTPTPHADVTTVPATPSVTPTPHDPAAGGAGDIYHAALLAAATSTPVATSTRTATPTAAHR
jgi:hypothetical protein